MSAFVYPVPAGEPVFDLYTVTVNGDPVSLYTARVSAIPFNRPWPGKQRPLEQTELAAVLSLDMTEPVTIEICCARDGSRCSPCFQGRCGGL